jgi:hypothetical protein
MQPGFSQSLGSSYQCVRRDAHFVVLEHSARVARPILNKMMTIEEDMKTSLYKAYESNKYTPKFLTEQPPFHTTGQYNPLRL